MLKKNLDLSLYLVTQREDLSLADFYRIILDSVAGGVSIVQLREKETNPSDIIKIGRGLLDLLRPLGIPLIINDSIELAIEIGADGVHLGQCDGCPRAARKILGPNAIIGLSIETLDQAQATNSNSMQLDYIAASPVFATPTKTDTAKPWGLHGLQELCHSTHIPVIAIGGINLSNIENIMKTGAAGVSVVSAIFKAKSPQEAAKELLTKIKKIKPNENYENQRCRRG